MSQEASEIQPVTKRKKGTDAIPELIWVPLVGGILTLIPGLIGLVMGNAWLFPSLGPTAFLQAASPQHPSSRFYNTLVGHLSGIAAGVSAVLVLAASNEPSVLATHQLYPHRVWASGLAIALTLLFQLLLRANHPPAAATTLLITLGGFNPNWKDVSTIIIGGAIIAGAGEIMRRLRLAQPGQK
ncbi:MAG: HPP family protein [Acidobacteria bacterium]|nr:MAG: HPP family protein [Acidobacteriota bacterium]